MELNLLTALHGKRIYLQWAILSCSKVGRLWWIKCFQQLKLCFMQIKYNVVIFHSVGRADRHNNRFTVWQVSDFPVILSLENHCGVEQQKIMAEHLSEILGDMLLTTLQDGQVPQQLPSPQVRICVAFVIFCQMYTWSETNWNLTFLIYYCVIYLIWSYSFHPKMSTPPPP